MPFMKPNAYKLVLPSGNASGKYSKYQCDLNHHLIINVALAPPYYNDNEVLN